MLSTRQWLLVVLLRSRLLLLLLLGMLFRVVALRGVELSGMVVCVVTVTLENAWLARLAWKNSRNRRRCRRHERSTQCQRPRRACIHPCPRQLLSTLHHCFRGHAYAGSDWAAAGSHAAPVYDPPPALPLHCTRVVALGRGAHQSHQTERLAGVYEGVFAASTDSMS